MKHIFLISAVVQGDPFNLRTLLNKNSKVTVFSAEAETINEWKIA